MDPLRDGALVSAAVTTGLLAGLYYAYACSVMPALRGADDRTFVDVMQRVNVAILNGWFLVSFAGAPAVTALAAGLQVADSPPAMPWVVTGAVLNLAAFLVTAVVNVPLNNALAAVGPADVADPARERFEARWVRWNVVRAVASTAALCCLVVALAR